jgi:hypothetical protein
MKTFRFHGRLLGTANFFRRRTEQQLHAIPFVLIKCASYHGFTPDRELAKDFLSENMDFMPLIPNLETLHVIFEMTTDRHSLGETTRGVAMWKTLVTRKILRLKPGAKLIFESHYSTLEIVARALILYNAGNKGCERGSDWKLLTG